MSWHFSRALVAAFSAENCSDGGPSALSKLSLSPALCSWRDKTMEACPHSRSGTMSAHSTDDYGVERWMSCLEDSHAKTYQSLETGTGLMVSVPGYGVTCGESSAKWDADTSSWRTRQRSLFGGLEQYSGTWPRWGMMRAGEFWALTMPAHLTSASVSGSWITPLKSQAPRGWGLSGGRARYGETLMRNALRDISEYGWKLNPCSHEWLMGWPIGWTGLSPLATDKFQRWRLSHGVCCQGAESNQPKP